MGFFFVVEINEFWLNSPTFLFVFFGLMGFKDWIFRLMGFSDVVFRC